MRHNQNDQNLNSEKADLGWVILIGAIALPFIVSALFAALLPYLFVGVVGLIAYRIYLYDLETDNVTDWFERQFNISKSNRSNSKQKSQRSSVSGRTRLWEKICD